ADPSRAAAADRSFERRPPARCASRRSREAALEAEHLHGPAGRLHHDQQSLPGRDLWQSLQLGDSGGAGAGRVGGGENHPDTMMLSADEIRSATAPLDAPLAALATRYPGESEHRQPVHTVYGGAHLFKSDTAVKLGTLAQRALLDHAPDAASFAD